MRMKLPAFPAFPDLI